MRNLASLTISKLKLKILNIKNKMIIQKRNDEQAAFNPTKILTRIKKAAKGLKVNTDEIFIKGITSLPNEGVVTTKRLISC